MINKMNKKEDFYVIAETIADEVQLRLEKIWNLYLTDDYDPTNDEPSDKDLEKLIRVVIKESVDYINKSIRPKVKIVFIDDNTLKPVSKEEMVKLVMNYFNDGLSDLYDSLAHDDGSNLCGGDAIYLTDGMYIMPNGDIVSEDEI